MDEIERKSLFSKFLENGMNIQEFKFRKNEDKTNLFSIFEEYMRSMLVDKKLIVSANIDSDITIYIDGDEICMIEITPDYSTLMCHTTRDVSDEDLIFCLTMLFLTIKELRAMMNILAKSFESRDSKNGKYKSLSSETKKIVNKIETIQKSILKNISKNKKYTFPEKK